MNIRKTAMKISLALLLCVGSLSLTGCGLVAAPCRVTSAGLKIIPLVGPVAAAPTDACANVIDPTPTRS
ncbi:MAG: phosphoribosylglycinamide formyltransferase [Acidiphilium sp.]|nr:phosphoribosylglycinamide formyltransferase [Acidiphilium sp.]MDD4936576.1 phosphoribosylglycinamide formyltransferase [Acidiphilium sp.]